MSEETGNLAKRIKRHVKGREHQITVICHPMFQDLLAAELESLGYPNEDAGPGIRSFNGKIDDIYHIHLASRIAVSVRVILMEFRCATREDLFSRMRGFAWEYWLKPDTPLRIAYSARNDRLAHDGRAQVSALKAISGRMEELFGERTTLVTGKSRSLEQKILIRVEGSRCQVSLDATGDLLYRRGYGAAQGKAPLRENLAAAIIAGSRFDFTQRIVDGMAGSGTFIMEALLQAAGRYPLPPRSFSFELWPVFNSASLESLRRKLSSAETPVASGGDSGTPGAATVTPDEAGRSTGASADIGEYHAVEIDPDVVPLLRRNLSAFADGPGFGLKVDAVNEDVFAWIYRYIDIEHGGNSPVYDGPGPAGTLLLNPPYDWRINRVPGMYRRIWNLFEVLMPAWQGIVLVPEFADGGLCLAEKDRIPDGLKGRIRYRSFPHGGKRIRALYISATE